MGYAYTSYMTCLCLRLTPLSLHTVEKLERKFLRKVVVPDKVSELPPEVQEGIQPEDFKDIDNIGG